MARIGWCMAGMVDTNAWPPGSWVLWPMPTGAQVRGTLSSGGLGQFYSCCGRSDATHWPQK